MTRTSEQGRGEAGAGRRVRASRGFIGVAVALVAACALWGAGVARGEPSRPQIELAGGGARPRLHLRSEVPVRWRAVVVRDGVRAAQPLMGRSGRRGAYAWFAPHLALAPGVTIEVEARDQAGALLATRRVQRPASRRVMQTARAEVSALWPARGRIPENALRFHVDFSAPMLGGADVFRFIQLEDERGLPVPAALRGIELWSSDRRRLTVLLHPGRVKRGVGFARTLGPVLRAGRTYRLVVRRGLRDVHGRALRAGGSLEFSVGPPDRTSPDPRRWRLQKPAVGTRAPLALTFDEPVDRNQAEHILDVRGHDGRVIQGAVEVSEDGARWQFTPHARWRDEQHALHIPTHLADLAGNTIHRRFDQRTTPDAPAARPSQAEPLIVHFTPR